MPDFSNLVCGTCNVNGCTFKNQYSQDNNPDLAHFHCLFPGCDQVYTLEATGCCGSAGLNDHVHCYFKLPDGSTCQITHTHLHCLKDGCHKEDMHVHCDLCDVLPVFRNSDGSYGGSSAYEHTHCDHVYPDGHICNDYIYHPKFRIPAHTHCQNCDVKKNVNSKHYICKHCKQCCNTDTKHFNCKGCDKCYDDFHFFCGRCSSCYTTNVHYYCNVCKKCVENDTHYNSH